MLDQYWSVPALIQHWVLCKNAVGTSLTDKLLSKSMEIASSSVEFCTHANALNSEFIAMRTLQISPGPITSATATNAIWPRVWPYPLRLGDHWCYSPPLNNIHVIITHLQQINKSKTGHTSKNEPAHLISDLNVCLKLYIIYNCSCFF